MGIFWVNNHLAQCGRRLHNYVGSQCSDDMALLGGGLPRQVNGQCGELCDGINGHMLVNQTILQVEGHRLLKDQERERLCQVDLTTTCKHTNEYLSAFNLGM